MISEAIIDALKSMVPKENVHPDEPLSLHTTFRVGGTADCLVEIESTEELVKIQKYLRLLDMPFWIFGNGSNVLVSDDGYRGVILEIGSKMADIRVEGNKIIAKAGALLSKIARAALDHGLTGLEFASGIPGSVGGAVVMNAGAYGGEMKQVVTEVSVLNPEGEVLVLDNETMEFGYRTSVIKQRPFIVTEVVMELEKGDPAAIKAVMDELSAKRREKQPLEYPSAGSTFKRPEGYFAGKLIMDAGLSGFQIGGAKVSEKHCGFLINTGKATAADIFGLIRHVQQVVYDKFGVDLEMEVILLGEF